MKPKDEHIALMNSTMGRIFLMTVSALQRHQTVMATKLLFDTSLQNEVHDIGALLDIYREMLHGVLHKVDYHYGIPISFQQLTAGLEKSGFKDVPVDTITEEIDRMMNVGSDDMNAIHNYIVHRAIDNIILKIQERDAFFRRFIQSKEEPHELGTNTRRAFEYADLTVPQTGRPNEWKDLMA
jgi:hypothetical protein